MGLHQPQRPGRSPCQPDLQARDPRRYAISPGDTAACKAKLVRLGHPIARSTVWQILHDTGVGPAPRRAGPAWKQFLMTQARGQSRRDFIHTGTVLLRRVLP